MINPTILERPETYEEWPVRVRFLDSHVDSIFPPPNTLISLFLSPISLDLLLNVVDGLR